MTGVCPPAINISPMPLAASSWRDYLLGYGPIYSYGVHEYDCTPAVQLRDLVLVNK